MDIPGAYPIQGVPDPGKPGHSEMCCIQTFLPYEACNAENIIFVIH